MDYLFGLVETFSVRLHAGAVGSLIGLITMPASPEVDAIKRLVCSWVVALICSPVIVAVAKSADITGAVVAKIHERELESVAAFLTGLVGWQVLGFVRRNAKNLSNEDVRKWNR